MIGGSGLVVRARGIASSRVGACKAAISALKSWLSFRLAGDDGGLQFDLESSINADFSRGDGGWEIVAHDFDPQIMLRGLPHPDARLGPAIFDVMASLKGDAALVGPEIHIDRGQGFGAEATILLRRIANDRWVARIENFHGVIALRFDPSDAPVTFTLHRLRLRRASPTDAFLQSVYELSIDAQSPYSMLLPQGPKPMVLPGVAVDGVIPLAMHDMEPDEVDGVFHLLNRDPQIVFDLAPVAETGAAVVRLTFNFTDNERLVGPMVYVAYGDEAFDTDRSFYLQPQPDGTHQAAIAFPALGARVRWDPSQQGGTLHLHSVTAEPTSLSHAKEAAVGAAGPSQAVQLVGADTSNSEEVEAWRREAMALTLRLNREGLNREGGANREYGRWLRTFAIPYDNEYPKIAAMVEAMPLKPKFSFVMPTYNPPVEFLEACISSLTNQTYPNFEICIADDCSTNPEVVKLLKRMAKADGRIKLKLRSENGHISTASNSALELAVGDYLVLIDHDDLVPMHCLATVAYYINENPDSEILYSDEDKIDFDGVRTDPYFKGGFNEYLMFGHNMISHLGVYKRALVAAAGGFRPGYEGSQDYDLFLRCLDKCGPSKVVHIPHILYHWRMLPGSTAVSADQKSYAIRAAHKCLNDHFVRKKLPYRSVGGVAPGLSKLGLKPLKTAPIVSIVIPTRDQIGMLKACVDSVLRVPDHGVEIVIVDNGSIENATLEFLEIFERDGVGVVCRSPGEFNFSHLCNAGVEASSGEIICLLNNDTEVLSPNWLDRARLHLSIPSIGAVGARLLYPDRTLQHFGLCLGLGRHRVASTLHNGLHENDFGYFGKARLIQEFSAVTAACMFVRRSDYLAVGGFDEALAVAYNDVDFCLKLRERGLKIICDPDLVLIHKESKSRGADTEGHRAARLTREAKFMRDKWAEQLDNDPYYSPNLTLDHSNMSLAPRPRVLLPWREQPAPSV